MKSRRFARCCSSILAALGLCLLFYSDGLGGMFGPWAILLFLLLTAVFFFGSESLGARRNPRRSGIPHASRRRTA